MSTELYLDRRRFSLSLSHERDVFGVINHRTSVFLDLINGFSFILAQYCITDINKSLENVVIDRMNMSSERRLSDLRNLVSGLYTLGKLEIENISFSFSFSSRSYHWYWSFRSSETCSTCFHSERSRCESDR